MSTKLESYIKEIKNFLEENYVCYEYKTPYFDSNEQLVKYQVRNDAFIIETKNAGCVFISVDLFTSRKPYKYDVFTQKYAYEFYNKEDKAFTCRKNTDGKFKKNNLYCQVTISHIKGFILREYESTKNNY